MYDAVEVRPLLSPSFSRYNRAIALLWTDSLPAGAASSSTFVKSRTALV